MTVDPIRAIEVFYSYDQADEPLLKELEKHLAILLRQGYITSWNKREISAGQEWKYESDKYLNRANIILLLVSPDFIASDYCYSIEMKRAMERHEAKEARVIPIILRPVSWEDALFGTLQVLPTNRRPVTSWPSRDEAF